VAEMSRMLGFWLDATETARFFASTAPNCDNVTFPGPRPDAMDGAVKIQRRRHRATGWGHTGLRVLWDVLRLAHSGL
jgi:hypothetical protein